MRGVFELGEQAVCSLSNGKQDKSDKECNVPPHARPIKQSLNRERTWSAPRCPISSSCKSLQSRRRNFVGNTTCDQWYRIPELGYYYVGIRSFGSPKRNRLTSGVLHCRSLGVRVCWDLIISITRLIFSLYCFRGMSTTLT